jgi:rod shape determining protein RodA
MRLRNFSLEYIGQGFRPFALLKQLKIDWPLVWGLVVLLIFGSIVLYSASGQHIDVVERQAARLGLACVVMITLAQIPPRYYALWTPWLFSTGLLLLVAVLIAGHIGKGGQRWLGVGAIRFQPSELMKVAVPLMLAWYLREQLLPPTLYTTATCFAIVLIPALLIAKQPDLGTALLIASAGFFVLFLAGLSLKLMAGLAALATAAAPIIWHFLYDYQKQRIFTFFDPEQARLSHGYHIIQSKIAIGSGGLFGKGWLNGTQSHLQFLPERSTDFIFAVIGEEFGFIGALVLILIYLYVLSRCFYISLEAQDTFTRLLAGSLTLTFFVYICVNIGMVIGILPVVGIPLPLISYGGTSMVTIFASFGMLMSIHKHRSLIY